MVTMSCPHCIYPLYYDPNQEGSLACCPNCQRDFPLPGPPRKAQLAVTSQAKHRLLQRVVGHGLLWAVVGAIGALPLAFLYAHYMPLWGGIPAEIAEPFTPERWSLVSSHAFVFGSVSAAVLGGLGALVGLVNRR